MKNGNINYSYKKELRIVFKRGKDSTVETNFDQYGNRVLKFETLNEVDEETVTKEKNIF